MRAYDPMLCPIRCVRFPSSGTAEGWPPTAVATLQQYHAVLADPRIPGVASAVLKSARVRRLRHSFCHKFLSQVFDTVWPVLHDTGNLLFGCLAQRCTASLFRSFFDAV